MTLKLKLHPRPSIIARVTPRLSGATLVAGDNIDIDQVGNVYTISATNTIDALAYNGMQINGSMEVSQEFGAANVVIPNGGFNKYFADGWVGSSNGAQTSNCATFAPGLSGFTKAAILAVSSGNSLPGVNDFCYIGTFIEGYRVARLAWGTADASSITICFWVNTSHAGLYGGSVTNAAFNRSYPFTFTMNAAGTYEYKTVTIPGDTTGTWLKDSNAGMVIRFALLTGNTYVGPSGAWATAGYLGPIGSINGIVATSDQMLLTGVVVLPGTQAPTAAQSPLIMRPYDQELVTCKRYYEKSYNYGTAPGTAVGAGTNGIVFAAVPNASVYQMWTGTFSVAKRAAPTITYYNGSGSAGFSYYNGAWNNTTGGSAATAITQNFVSFSAGAGSAGTYMYGFDYTADARL